MRQDTKIIRFDFDFTYSRAGRLEKENAIVISEPSFEKQSVFHRMRSFCARAEKSRTEWALKHQHLFRDMARAAEEAPQDTSGASDDRTDGGASGSSALALLRNHLVEDDYLALIDYVQRELVGARSLAWVGSDSTLEPKERFELNAGSWRSIVENGGLDALERVIGEFADFFLDRTSRTASSPTATTAGTTSPSEPVVLATAASHSPMPSRSR